MTTTKEENLRVKRIDFVKAKKKHAHGRARGVALMSDVMQFLCHTICVLQYVSSVHNVEETA